MKELGSLVCFRSRVEGVKVKALSEDEPPHTRLPPKRKDEIEEDFIHLTSVNLDLSSG